MMRRFPTREEAHAFIEANRNPELFDQPLFVIDLDGNNVAHD